MRHRIYVLFQSFHNVRVDEYRYALFNSFAFEKYEDKIMQWSDKIKNNLYLCMYILISIYSYYKKLGFFVISCRA